MTLLIFVKRNEVYPFQPWSLAIKMRSSGKRFSGAGWVVRNAANGNIMSLDAARQPTFWKANLTLQIKFPVCLLSRTTENNSAMPSHSPHRRKSEFARKLAPKSSLVRSRRKKKKKNYLCFEIVLLDFSLFLYF